MGGFPVIIWFYAFMVRTTLTQTDREFLMTLFLFKPIPCPKQREYELILIRTLDLFNEHIVLIDKDYRIVVLVNTSVNEWNQSVFDTIVPRKLW